MFCLIFAVSLGSCDKKNQDSNSDIISKSFTSQNNSNSANSVGNVNTDESSANLAEAEANGDETNGNDGGESAPLAQDPPAPVDTNVFNVGDSVRLRIDGDACVLSKYSSSGTLTKSVSIAKRKKILVGTTYKGRRLFVMFDHGWFGSNYVYFYTGDDDTTGINLAIGKNGTQATVTPGENGRLAFKNVVVE
jgi:hypothetical protein